MALMPIYYTTNNTRKRKKTKKKVVVAKKLDRSKLTGVSISSPSYRRETPYIPSNNAGIGDTTKRDNNHELEVSKNYTIAPAYNKGAYQVIGKDSIKDIGR
jgi:hypothetical protein|tara:strand:+ start:423 stop:725 length:303 start_codon:yes stop_codon:yes gene_type:complete